MVTILAPASGARMNAESLEVQALAAVFEGDGPTLVTLAVDGATAGHADLRGCRRQALAAFKMDLSKLANGPHQLSVTAVQGDDEERATGTASATFVIDRTLNAAVPNPIEQAATPQAFTCLSLHSGEDDDKNERSLRGRMVLGQRSDGIDLASDRVVVSIGASVAVIEPGSFACEGRRVHVCRFKSDGLIQEMTLRGQGRFWSFEVEPKVRPAGTFLLRIGDDWGGIDLVTRQPLFGLRPAYDTQHVGSATIGAAGGSVETVDANGVRIHLEVPAGALTADTPITITPLLASPLALAGAPLHPGVQLQPEGLQLARAATLAFDFSLTNQAVSSLDTLYLITSPLTTMPLLGTVDVAHQKVSAHLHHFSAYDPSAPTAPFEDLKAWADPILNATGGTSFQALEGIVALARDQMALGCKQNCIDLGRVAATLSADIALLVSEACPLDIGSPSDQALSRWLELEALAQGLGASAPTLRPCIKQILSSQIDKASVVAASPAAGDPVLSMLVSLAAKAQQLGFGDLQTKAFQKLDQALLDLAARLTATGHASDGTANEPQAHQGAITSLKQEQLWVTTIEPALATVDPNLAATLQKDIDDFSSNVMSVKVEPYSTFASASASDNCSQTGGSTGGVVDRLSLESSPPVSLSASATGAGGSGSAGCTVSQPAPNILTWDAFAGGSSDFIPFCSDPIGGSGSASLSAALTFQRPGKVAIDMPGGTSFSATFGSDVIYASQSFTITPGSYSLSAATSGYAIGVDNGPVISRAGGGKLTVTFTPQ